MLASMKYKMLHIRLHYATVARLNQIGEEIGAPTYAELIRHLLQHWERRGDIKTIQIPADAGDTN